MLNTCQEQIACARPIGPHGEIQLAGKFTADNMLYCNRKKRN